MKRTAFSVSAIFRQVAVVKKGGGIEKMVDNLRCGGFVPGVRPSLSRKFAKHIHKVKSDKKEMVYERH